MKWTEEELKEFEALIQKVLDDVGNEKRAKQQERIVAETRRFLARNV